MARIFAPEEILKDIPLMLAYLPVTLEIALFAMVLAVVLGLLLALIRIRKVPVLRQIAAVYISALRGTPIIVQLYIAYFGIPMIVKYFTIQSGGTYVADTGSGIVYAIIALGLNESAYLAETFRSALLSVDQGQIEAASSIGMTYPQALRRIILPEMITVALPNLGNSLIGLIKGTSLAFACAVVEMTAEGKIIGGRSYRYFEVYISLAIIYWAITILIEQIIRLIEKKLAIPQSPKIAAGADAKTKQPSESSPVGKVAL